MSNVTPEKTILPPEAHRSRDGNTMITILMDNEYYAWNTMDALSWYYSNYSINEVYTNWEENEIEYHLENTDVLLVPYGHWISNYYWNGPSFGEIVEPFLLNGGTVLFTGYNNWELDYFGLFGEAYLILTTAVVIHGITIITGILIILSCLELEITLNFTK